MAKATKVKVSKSKKVTPKMTEHICLVLDESGSMGHIEDSVRELIASTVKSICEKSAKYNLDTRFSYVVFSWPYKVQTVLNNVPIDDVLHQQLTYQVDGNTALYDGVGQAIDVLEKNPAESQLLIVITDGQENSSQRWNGQTIFNRIVSLQQKGGWTFTFQVPNEVDKNYLVRAGISVENIRVWEATRKGTIEACTAIAGGLDLKFSSRQLGQVSIPNYYAPVTTDLSQISSVDLKKNLADITKQLEIHKVPKEQPIKEFVLGKGKPFVLGQCYYQLTKNEIIQPQKKIIIYDKTTKKFYSGQEARHLIGLPDNQKAKVEIGNHSNYDIYAQSTSVNRKLVRGTNLLLDKNHNHNSSPTWGTV